MAANNVIGAVPRNSCGQSACEQVRWDQFIPLFPESDMYGEYCGPLKKTRFVVCHNRETLRGFPCSRRFRALVPPIYWAVKESLGIEYAAGRARLSQEANTPCPDKRHYRNVGNRPMSPRARFQVSDGVCRLSMSDGDSKVLAALVVPWRSHDKETAYNHHLGTVMRRDRTDQTPTCSFCQKGLRAAKRLIRSPEGWAYICDECALETRRLRLEADKSAARNEERSSLLFHLSRILRNALIGPRSRCSFCAKKPRFFRLFVSSFQFEIQSKICKDCLTACRQVLKEEAESGRRSVTSARFTPRQIILSVTAKRLRLAFCTPCLLARRWSNCQDNPGR